MFIIKVKVIMGNTREDVSFSGARRILPLKLILTKGRN